MNQISDVLELQRDLERYQKFVRDIKTDINLLMTMDISDDAYAILQDTLDQARTF